MRMRMRMRMGCRSVRTVMIIMPISHPTLLSSVMGLIMIVMRPSMKFIEV
jgi:hypothetical protein